jgi:hypothetical protein
MELSLQSQVLLFFIKEIRADKERWNYVTNWKMNGTGDYHAQ